MKKYGYPASENAIVGYDLASFFGNQLLENGTYFLDKLNNNNENIEGDLSPYFNYFNSNSNTFIPVLKMEKYVLIPQNINKNEPVE